MARQLKPYICRLREELERHDLYHERNDSLIRDVALAELIRDNYLDSFKDHGPVIYQVGSQGQGKISINKAYIEIRKMLATIINGKAKLGMGNIGARMDEETNTAFEDFINELQGDGTE